MHFLKTPKNLTQHHTIKIVHFIKKLSIKKALLLKNMFHIKQSEQNQMSISSVASSMVSISSSSEEQNSDLVNGVSGKCHGSTKNGSGKNRSGSATSDNERCECYHNNKKRRSAKVSRCFGNAYLCMPPNLLCFKV